MSSELRDRLHAAAAIAPRPVSGAAIQAEVSRRRRVKHRLGAAGVLTVALALGASLPFALSGGPQTTARLGVSPSQPATPSALPSPSKQAGVPATLRLSWAGLPRDGGTATVTGAGFSPGASVEVVPCIPNSDCGGYRPIAVARAGSDGAFSTQVVVHAVVADLYGGTEMCAQNCTLVALTSNGGDTPLSAAAKSAVFDLATLPPASQQCQPQVLEASYAGAGPAEPNSQSAIIKVRNTGTSVCWVFGPPTAGAPGGGRFPVSATTVDQSAPAWPPKVIMLAAGSAARFTLVKPRCAGTSVALGEIELGLNGGNYFVSVPLRKGGTRSNLALCTAGSGTAGDQPAPDNVITVSAFIAA